MLCAPFAAQANPAFRAFDATPIFGDSREVVRENNQFTYRFTYRGGTVTYRPKIGADWKKDGTTVESVKFSFGMGPRIKKSLTGKDASEKSDSAPDPPVDQGSEPASPPVKPPATNVSPAEQAQSPPPIAQSAPTQTDGGSE